VLSNEQADKAPSAKKLLRLAPWGKGGGVEAELDLGRSALPACLALDDSADPAVVWAGGDLLGRRCLLRIEDAGREFKVVRDLVELSREPFGVKPRMAVHPETDTVICSDGTAQLAGYNGLTGEPVKLPSDTGADMGVGLDGNWYLQTGGGYSGPIQRYDKDLKPLPIAGSSSNVMGEVYGRMGAGFCTAGVTADARGRVYSVQLYKWADYCVVVFGPDGKPEEHPYLKDHPEVKTCPRFRSALVGPLEVRPAGIQLDWKGNIYLGLGATPRDLKPPEGFANDAGFRRAVGGVVKFKPEGGQVHMLKEWNSPPPAGKEGLVMVYRHFNFGGCFIENAVAYYPGIGCMAGNLGNPCWCRMPMFQVDGWGRIFYPNAVTYSVRAVDNAGNEILTFGRYGNSDSRGPGKDSLVRTPDVPLGWPEAVGVSEKAIYVADVLNRRIVRLLKKYAAEEAAEVK
jgi:hypothetical protein